jgi:hypothetical protein
LNRAPAADGLPAIDTYILTSLPSSVPVVHSAPGVTRAVLVGVDLGSGHAFDPALDELALLAASAGALLEEIQQL